MKRVRSLYSPKSHPRHEGDVQGVCLRTSGPYSSASIPEPIFLPVRFPVLGPTLQAFSARSSVPYTGVTSTNDLESWGVPEPTVTKGWGKQLLQSATCQTSGHLFPSSYYVRWLRLLRLLIQ